ncbi:MAG: hypothetical protein EWM51_04440 [Treponema sp.]|nr:MAG: hypothetical protein EWM51_04440 [Treponema sp.]
MARTASDTLALKAVNPVVVTIEGPSGAVDLSGNALSWTAPDWSQYVPIGQGSGTYTVSISVEDSVGRITSTTRTVIVDTAAPSVLIQNLTANQLITQTSYTVSGSSSDGTGSGVALVEYSVDGGSTWIAAIGTTTWTAALPPAPAVSLAETLTGDFRIRSTDAAGNVSGETSRTFRVDTSKPSVTNLNLDGASFTAGTKYVKTNYAITFTLADTLALQSYTITRNGTAITGHDNVSISGTSVNVTVNETVGGGGLADGVYEYKLTVKDAVYDVLLTNDTVVERTVMIDSAAPILSITAPVAGEGVDNNSYTIRGTVDDGSGKGVTELGYSTVGAGGPWTPITRAASWSATGIDFSGAEGSRTLWVRATDGLNDPVIKSVAFQYDTAYPVLTESSDAPFGGVGSTDTQYTNATVTFAGSVSDTNALASFVARINGGEEKIISIDADGPDNTSATADDNYWTYTFDSAARANNTYALSFIAKDAANQSTTVSRTVVVDKNVPTIDSFTGVDNSTWYTTASRAISGTASDTGSSGLLKIEYRISPDGTAPSFGDWVSLTGTSTFTGTISFSDGNANLLQVRAVDRAGNTSVLTERTVWIDTMDPSFDITDPVTTPVDNGNGTLDISIEATDDTSGPVTLFAKVGDYNWGTGTVYSAAITDIDAGAGVTWGATVNIADLSSLAAGNRKIYLRVQDASGRFSIVMGQSIIIDKTPPTVTFASHSTGATINKLVTFSGTASDSNGIDSVAVEVYKNTGTEGAPTWAWIPAESGAPDGTTSWELADFNTSVISASSALYDSDAGTTGLQLRVRARVLDAANNETIEERTFLVDQDADRPVVRLSNVKTDGTTTLINTTTVSGTLLDDDGTVALANFAVSEDGTTWASATANSVLSNPGNPLFYDVDTRSFQYSPSAGDGQKYLYFRITDAALNTFATPVAYVAGDILTYPKLQFSTDSGSAVGSRVAYKIDTNPPDIQSDIYFDFTDPWSFDGATPLADEYRLLNNAIFGGVRAEFALRVAARDTVGIQSVALTVDGTSYAMSKVSGVAGDWEVFTSSATVPIDVSAWTSGVKTVSVLVTDNSGQTSSSTRQIVIDNTNPIVEVSSHAMNEQVTGDVTFRGTTNDGTGSGIATVQYRVGVDAAWKPVTGTFSWNIGFTGANIITTIGTYANATHATETSDDSNVWILPIYIRAIDRTGNETIETFYLNVNPDGDNPTVTVLYPTTGSTLGGTIRVFGSAQDNISVASVWMMIDADGDGDYDTDDVTLLTGYGYTVEGTDANSWGFKISGTASWSQSINGSGEFNPPDAGQRMIRFRIRARDNNGTDGTWSSDRILYVDNNVPRIGSSDPLRLVQYTDETFTTIAAERDYVSDMYIRGEWYLEGSVEDESGIRAINVTGSDSGTLSTEPTWFIQGALNSTTGLYNYSLRIPVGRPLTDTSTGQQSYSIYVEDGSDPTGVATQGIVLNYDNQAPVVDVLTNGGLKIDATNPIMQSNNAYTFASTVTEAGLTDSGFERLVFFFVRTGATPRVYNPMTAINPDQLDTDVTGNRTYLSQLTWTAGDIPRLQVSGATRSGEDSLTHASIENNDNVRIGGLVRIAGVDRLIKSVNPTTGNITFTPGADVSFTDASFAYGLVVDNTTIETGVWTGSTLTSITNDDGDRMIESVVKSGGSFAWDASINSLNIPDGPIELRYVAYDKAGNSVAGVATTAVSNNRPRIARVLLGTDLSGDNAFSSTEIATYYTAISGSEPSLVNLASSSFIMKGRLAVIPEFVGGNGTLRYVWASNGTTADAWDGITYPTASFGGPLLDFTTVTLSDDAATSYTTSIVIPAADVSAMDDVLKLFSFVVWDETEETTQGTTSQWARLNVPVNVDVVDSVAPVVVISPFFWTSSSVNSLYGGSKNNGHIEIGLNALGDTDPKVSGSISIRGTAYDDQRLSALYAFIGANTGTVSTYAFTSATETKAFDGRTYARMATYDPDTNIWTGTDQWATNGWSFTVTPDYQDQSGHKVNWQLNINTTRITNVAALNQLIRIVAEDRTPNASSETANPTGLISTNNVPGYQVDVVPYISSITNPTGLSVDVLRGSTGKYSVEYHATNTLTVNGFNLGAAGNLPSARVSPAVITAPAGLAPATTLVSAQQITVSKALTRSGYLTVFVNSIPSLNNVTDTNTAEYHSEKEVTKVYSERWTDDRYLWVWNLTQVLPAATTQTFYYPSMIMEGNQPIFTYCNDNEGSTRRTTSDVASARRATLWFERQTSVAYADGAYWILSVEDAFSVGAIGFLQINRDGNVAAPYGTAGNAVIELIGEDYTSRQLNRFRYPKLLGETNGAGADLYVAYYDMHPSHQNITFMALRATAANTTAAGFTQATNDDTRAGPAFVLQPAEAGAGFSQYYDMVKYGANNIAIVYYDEVMSLLRLAYSTNATTGNNVANAAATWTTITLDTDLYAGSHVSMTNDANYLYVAYYDSANANLKTVRVAHATMTASAPVVVDSWLSAGTWTNIQMMDFDGMGTAYENVPVISYYSDSFNGTKKPVKLAFPIGYANVTNHGVLNATSEAFSGNWEIMTVPAVTAPRGGMEQFNRTQIDVYTNNEMNLPVVGWLADRLEYAKLQPNNN